MRNALLSFVVLLMFTTACHQSFHDYNEIKDMSGIWKLKLDPDNIGMKDQWFNKEFNDSIWLPGTTDEHKKGTFLDEQAVDRLSRVWYWKGAAWYQKEVVIPENWSGKNVKLLLERTKDTHVWFDDIHCGYENTLSAYQYFDLTKAIKPGLHRITVLVDNAKLPPVGPSHAVDERTQTNWNGIVGRIELQATDPVWIDEVQVYPDVKNMRVKIRVNIGNITGSEARGELEVAAESWNTGDPVKFQTQKQEIAGITKDKLVEFTYDFNKEAPLWDEFDPALIKLSLSLSSSAGDENYTSSKQVDFGMREFKREGKHILLNGDRVYLRGRIDCANYPITGYPPMDKQAWLKLFRQLKTYGINHWRFHSWCPPKEALNAADELGVYLQPELPNKRSGMDKKSMDEEAVRAMRNIDYLQVDTSRVNMTLKDYLQREGELIFKDFGNHPSFTMFTLGNELGRNPAMYKLVANFKELDPRRLYAQGSNTMHWDQSFAEGDDFWVCAKTGTEHGPVRGAYFFLDYAYGHIENFSPSTLVDYSASIKDFDVPVIAHENGAHQVSPDFTEIPKYTGVTRARNYEIFRERLIKANMLDQADDFVKASGKLAVICYREEVEAALRTRDIAGFQLLDIQDFPGQGTAPVGILNDFMESKGLITPDKWRQFCSEVVPLLKMSKYTWTNDEEFRGDIEIAHYGKEDFIDGEVSWKLVTASGASLSEGIFTQVNIARGGVSDIGEITSPLKLIEKAEKLKIVISLEGTGFKNEYDIWVYPKTIDTNIPEGVLVSEQMDSMTRTHLQNGGKAIIIPDHNELTHCIKGAFKTDYWSPMFAQAAIRKGVEPDPGSMGFICDPDSPLFEHFPTEFHSNWQWWQLVKNCKPVILDETPADYKPMVQTIDNFARNHKMGMIFESKYGRGSVLICAIDLLNLQDKPEARQLYYSILNYVKSDDFSPEAELGQEVLNKILP